MSPRLVETTAAVNRISRAGDALPSHLAAKTRIPDGWRTRVSRGRCREHLTIERAVDAGDRD